MLAQGQQVPMTAVNLLEKHTVAPDPLREADLVALMDTHGIGTDASIPQHIRTICDRRYVVVRDRSGNPVLDEASGSSGSVDRDGTRARARARDGRSRGSCRGNRGGGRPKGNMEGLSQQALDGSAFAAWCPPASEDHTRFLVPSRLGMAVIDAFARTDPTLVEAAVRAGMERDIALIATGTIGKQAVLDTILSMFLRKYRAFCNCLDEVRCDPVDSLHIDSHIQPSPTSLRALVQSLYNPTQSLHPPHAMT